MLTVHRPVGSRGKATRWIGPAPWITTPPPGPNALQAVTRDRRVASTSYDRPYPLVVRRSQGSVVEDVDGNRFLDFAAGGGACSSGHGHPQVLESIRRQAGELIHVSGNQCHHEPMIALAEKLAHIAPGHQAKRVLFTNSGTEAVEAAIKLARHYARRKTIIAFQGASHGRTLGALSLSASRARHKDGFGPFIPMVEHVPYGDLDAIRNVVFKRIAAPEEIAAIFVEPLLGEGGCVVPPPDFLPGLRALCDEHDILLAVDEVQTGMGRTGRMFCCEHDSIEPDLLLLGGGLGSGMPLGAVVARQPVMNWPAGSHGSTFGGNPVSCAAALTTIELLEHHLIANTARLYPIALNKLVQIASRHKCIIAPRGRGLMQAVDVVENGRTRTPDPQLRDRILTEAFSRGLLLIGCGESGIRFTPPLCINHVQLEVGLDVFDEVVATVAT